MQEIQIMRISTNDSDDNEEIISQSIKCGVAGFTHVFVLDFDDAESLEAIAAKEELSEEVKNEIADIFVRGDGRWGYDTLYELPDSNVKLIVV